MELTMPEERAYTYKGKLRVKERIECPECNGKGYRSEDYPDWSCDHCDGSGEVLVVDVTEPEAEEEYDKLPF